jgi:hypothetical protein
MASAIAKASTTKPFAHCSLHDLALEISLAACATAGSALDAAAAAHLLPRLADAEATEAALQRHPLLRGASGLVCTGTAQSRQAWCSMLRDLFSVSGAAVSDAVLLRVYLVCKDCALRGHVQLSDSSAAACVGAHVESVVVDGTNDTDVAREAWDRYKMRNDSFVVDTCQSQMRSRVTCTECSNMSVSFDPSMYLGLSFKKLVGVKTWICAV